MKAIALVPRVSRWLVWVLLAAFFPSLGFSAIGPRTINLQPFQAKSQFQTVDADWRLPRGRQVVEGVPFRVDGVVEVAGSSARFSNVGRTNVNDIPIGGLVERFYLLAAASRDVNEGVTLARLVLHYADGSEAMIPIDYGRHVGDWMGARHKGETPLSEPDSRVAWQVEHAAAAKRDDSLRLYYTWVANPDPAREVRALSIRSARARGGFMLAALTVGPERIEPGDRAPDTLMRVEEHFHIEGAPGGKPALTGRVYDEKGAGLEGAMVRVLSVKTVDTSDALTPADSAVVGREVKSDSTGSWRMPDLSERLLYRLLVAAPGTQAGLYDGADPLAGPVELRLRPGAAGETGQYLVHGRLLGPDGKPVVGASVKPDGVGVGFNTSWGGNSDFPSEIVTGLNGEFIMARERAFTRMSVDIKAAGLAPAKVWLAVSNGVHPVPLGVGATLTGRVLKGKQPMADIEVGVSGVNRNSEVFAGHYEVRTDADGRFRFEHLPPNTEWYVYGLMKSLRRDGSLPPRLIKSGAHGESADLGDLEVQRSVSLSGRVRTASGEPVPSNLRLTVSYDSVWDNQQARVDRTGKFELAGLHPGLITLYFGSTGNSSQDWMPTGANRSLDEWSARSLTGLLTNDKSDLEIVVEKRDRNAYSYFNNNGSLPESDRSRNLPLEGAEASGTPLIRLAGTVVDEATGEWVRSARVTPGRKPIPAAGSAGGGLVGALVDALRARPVPWNERTFWEQNRPITSADGRFEVLFRCVKTAPLLRVEADGYLGTETAPQSGTVTNLVVRLKKGSGPKGTLLRPDGQPASGVPVIFGGDNDQFPVSEQGKLSAYGDDQATTVTDARGAFSLPPKTGGRRVFAADESGWFTAAAQDWPADGRVRLLPWAQVSGVLVGKDGQPAVGVHLAIEIVRHYDAGDAWVNFQERPMTDAKGRFLIRRVPPGEVRLFYLVPMNNSGWMHVTQTNFTVAPGKTLDLGTMIQAPNRN